MENYNFNVFTKRNPWLPTIFAICIIPFYLIMLLIASLFTNTYIIFAIMILAFFGALFLSLYSLQVLYEINIGLLKIDSNAPSKNSWFIAIGLSLFLIGIPYYWYLLLKFSKSIEKISSGQITTIVTFLLLFFIFPLGVTYVQYNLNQLQQTNQSNQTNQSSQPTQTNQPTPNNQYNQPTQNSLSANEETSKNYIEQYKSQYTREQIKQSLISSGINENEVETYLNKYF